MAAAAGTADNALVPVASNLGASSARSSGEESWVISELLAFVAADTPQLYSSCPKDSTQCLASCLNTHEYC